MTLKTATTFATGVFALTLLGGTAAFAANHAAEDPMAEAQAFLASPTSMAAAIATAEAETGGKVSHIEYETGEHGAPNLIMAEVIMADGTETIVAINPADGKVMNVTLASEDGDEGDGNDESDGKQENGGDGGSEGESEGGEGETN